MCRWSPRLAGLCLALVWSALPLAGKTHRKARRIQTPAHAKANLPVRGADSSGKSRHDGGDTPHPSSLGSRVRSAETAIEEKGHLTFTGYAAGEYSSTPSTTGFSLNQLHLEALGRAGDRVRWKAEVQLDHQAHWSDLYLQTKWTDHLWLQTGQFKVPFSQESLSGNTTIESIERPLAVTRMAPGRENHGGGQELGGTIGGDVWQVHGRPWLRYATGLFSGRTLDMPGGPRPRQAAVRLISSPLPAVMMAVDYARGAAPGQAWTRTRSDLEGSVHAGDWTFQGEYLSGHDGALQSRGAYAQAAWRFLPQWDAFVLVDHYRPNLRRTGGEERSLLGGLNWHLTRTLRMQINEGVRRTRPEPSFKPYFLCQLQWKWGR